MSLDDAYPVLGPRLGAPDWASLSAHASTDLDAPGTWLQMATTSEVLMTVAELLVHAGCDNCYSLSVRCIGAWSGDTVKLLTICCRQCVLLEGMHCAWDPL